MREADTKQVTERPTVEAVRVAIDARLRGLGRGSRAAELRRVGMPPSTLERILREGLSRDPRSKTVPKLRRMGILDLIPRR